MTTRIIILLVVVAFLLLIELYTYFGIKSFIAAQKNSLIWWVVYFTFTFLCLGSIVLAVTGAFQNNTIGIGLKAPLQNFVQGLTLTLILTKLVFASVFLIEDVFRVIAYLFNWGSSLFASDSDGVNMSDRRKFVTQIGLGLASIPFISFLHGITLGKYNFTVNRVKLAYDDLPSAFDGYKIIQISDVHSGSFDSLKAVQKGLDLINNENADLILFTGDLVNNKAEEIEPFIPMFNELQAKDGKYSVVGNHDYGDYVRWSSPQEKKDNFSNLMENHGKMGFNLLMNENVSIKKGGDQFTLAGVENWGKPPFPQHGDLNKALNQVNSNEFTVLMSHDPSHWDEQVIDHDKKIHLTLSGHTHGMQFGVDIPGFKWSPVKYKYPRWAGLYEAKDQFLYVNKGFGFLGFPGRVGMWPEITVFELTSKTA